MNQHLQELIERHAVLSSCEGDIRRAAEVLIQAYEQGGKVLLCGNGGSAADAEHWAGELLKGFHKTRNLDPQESALLGEELARNLQGALPTIPLVGFPSFDTAFSNDNDPEYIFAQLTWGMGRAGDALVGISTSGNSRNVIHALKVARARNMATVALVGEDGGAMRDLADISICVPARVTHLVQELHLPVYHCISLMLEEHFFGHTEGR